MTDAQVPHVMMDIFDIDCYLVQCIRILMRRFARSLSMILLAIVEFLRDLAIGSHEAYFVTRSDRGLFINRLLQIEKRLLEMTIM